MWWKKTNLQSYERRLNELRNSAKLSGLTDAEIEQTIQESLHYIKNRPIIRPPSHILPRLWLTRILITMALVAVVYIFLDNKSLGNLLERNIQEVIYPFMTIYRRVTLPIIGLFPAFTALYDESCLLENPYFHVADMDCSPCQSAKVVLNLTESIGNAHIGLPFIIKTAQNPVTMSDIRNAYFAHKQMIDQNSKSLISNIGMQNVADLFEDKDSFAPHGHVMWRINRMEVGRVLRGLLRPPMPQYTPHHASSMGIERFLLVDGAESDLYSLPSTEGANVFIRQLSGHRLIVLKPVPNCIAQCRKLSVLLEPAHILWYNWWYWRAHSYPVFNTSTTSVAFIGSTS